MTPELLKGMQVSKVRFVAREAALSVGLSVELADTLAQKAAYDYEHMQDYTVRPGPSPSSA